MLDDGHAHAALQRQQGELRRQRLDLADPNLLAGALRREPMQVRVVAVLHLAARRAVAARPACRVRIEAQQATGQVQGERRLADDPAVR